jgi:hypothetical protein
MSGEIVKVTFQVEGDQLTWLEDMVATYDLKGVSAALRAALAYAIEHGDEEEMFTSGR